MNVDRLANKITSSLESLQLPIQRAVEKKTPADKYILSESKASQPIAQLGIPKYMYVAADRMRACGGNWWKMQNNAPRRKLRRATWIGGVRFPRGTTIFYMPGLGKVRKVMGAHLIRKQVVKGIKCAPGYIMMHLNKRRKLHLEFVQYLSQDQYLQSHLGRIKCAKKTAVLFRGKRVSATLAAPLKVSKDLTLPIGTRLRFASAFNEVVLGKDIRYKGILLKKGTRLLFNHRNNHQPSQAHHIGAYMVKGEKCTQRAIYFKQNGKVSSILCYVRRNGKWVGKQYK